MKKFNLRSIMKSAWKLVKQFGYTMATAMKTAWSNAKLLAQAVKDNLITETVKTHYGWTMSGREVIHGEKCLFQIKVVDPATKTGYRTQSYFAESQTCELGTQPAKA